MTPSESLKPKHDWRWPLINTLLLFIGRAAIKLGHWPDRQIALTAGQVIRAAGGTAYRESGSPCGEIQNIYFHLRGRRIRLCIEEYGAVTLWGPRSLVRELSKAIEAKGQPVTASEK